MKRMLGAVGIAVGALCWIAGPAFADSGNQSFTIVGQDSTGTVIGNGPISGVGTDLETGDTTDTFVFDGGSIDISHIDNPGGSDSFNPVTCTDKGTFSGNYTIVSGTGAYANATGSGTYSGRFFFIGQRGSDGNCSEDGGTSFFIVRISGTTDL